MRSPVHKKQTIRYRKIHAIDSDSFRVDIKNSNLMQTDNEDVTELINDYNEILTGLLDKHAPVIEKKVYVRANSPWYTDEIRLAKVAKRQVERRWVSNKLTVNWDMLSTARKNVNKLCMEDKIQNQMIQKLFSS